MPQYARWCELLAENLECLSGGKAAAIKRGYDGSHTGSRNSLDSTSHCCERLEHPDVSDAARSASAQRQTKARATRSTCFDHRDIAWPTAAEIHGQLRESSQQMEEFRPVQQHTMGIEDSRNCRAFDPSAH